jgi:hypothetical protein
MRTFTCRSTFLYGPSFQRLSACLSRGRDPVCERGVAAGHVPRRGHRHLQEHPRRPRQYQPRQEGRPRQAVIAGLNKYGTVSLFSTFS